MVALFTDTSRSPSRAEGLTDPPGSLAIIGDPQDRRAALFAHAWRSAGGGPTHIRSYEDVVRAGGAWLTDLDSRATLRIDSPGRSFAAMRTILLAGLGAAAAEGSPVLSEKQIEELRQDPCRIAFTRQWYLGLVEILGRIRRSLRIASPPQVTSDPSEILVLFDKRTCHSRLWTAGVTVPRSLPDVLGFDDLASKMRSAGLSRVFIKLAHGSAASGTVAFETNGARHRAWTTVELVRDSNGLRLYNTRRLRRYTDPHMIRQLIDSLAPHRIHVEQWLPKATLHGYACDLRVLVIDGRAAHQVLRLSQGPITNLHLGNRREDARLLKARMSPAAWEAVLATAEKAARCFPRCLHVALDLAVSTNFRCHAVLEANAFGDLLDGSTYSGLTPYELQIRAIRQRLSPPSRPSHAQCQ